MKSRDELQDKICAIKMHVPEGLEVFPEPLTLGKFLHEEDLKQLMSLIDEQIRAARLDELQRAKLKKLPYFVKRFDGLNNFRGVMVSPKPQESEGV